MPWVTNSSALPTLRSSFTRGSAMQTLEITDAANAALPHYGTKPRKPGLYLGLFHGRHQPNEQMDSWGFDGPTIGPLKWCHTTYAADIKIEFEQAADAVEYFGVKDVQFE